MSVSSPIVSAVKATESPELHVTAPMHSLPTAHKGRSFHVHLCACLSAHPSAQAYTRHRGSFFLAALQRSSAHVRGHWLGFARVNPTSFLTTLAYSRRNHRVRRNVVVDSLCSSAQAHLTLLFFPLSARPTSAFDFFSPPYCCSSASAAAIRSHASAYGHVHRGRG